MTAEGSGVADPRERARPFPSGSSLAAFSRGEVARGCRLRSSAGSWSSRTPRNGFGVVLVELGEALDFFLVVDLASQFAPL